MKAEGICVFTRNLSGAPQGGCGCVAQPRATSENGWLRVAWDLGCGVARVADRVRVVLGDAAHLVERLPWSLWCLAHRRSPWCRAGKGRGRRGVASPRARESLRLIGSHVLGALAPGPSALPLPPPPL